MSEFVRTRFEVGETAVTIAADGRHVCRATEAILRTRRDIVDQISDDPYFLTTFEPYDCPRSASDTVRRMCDAAGRAGVGPMATVAGTVAQTALEAMMEDGCTHGWVDNGGDLALTLERPVTVEVFCEPGSPDAFALVLPPTDGVHGVCASSGRLGHSISLGDADVAVAQCDSAVLADALATALGNSVRSDEDLSRCFEPFAGTAGLVGGMVLRDGNVGMYGRLEGPVAVEHNPGRVTVHSRMSLGDYAGPRTGADGTWSVRL